MPASYKVTCGPTPPARRIASAHFQSCKTEARTVSARSERRTLIDALSISKPAHLSLAMAMVVISVLALSTSFLLPSVQHVFINSAIMNVLHISTEFLFGRHFPEITQHLDDLSKVP